MDEYLIHYNHNHDKLGRFARSIGSAGGSVGGKLSGKKDKKNTTRKYESTKRLASKKTKASEIKAGKKKGSKSNNTKLSDSERKRLVEHASIKEVIKNKEKLSNRELEAAITRLQKEKSSRADLERKLSDLSNPINEKNTKSFVDKMSDLGATLDKATTAVDRGVKAYNMAAKIHNSRYPNEPWTVIGEKEGNKKNILEMQKVVMTGSLADVWKNREKMTPAQYKNAVDRFGNDAKLQSMINEQKSSKSSSSASTNSSSGTNTSSNTSKKESNPSIESYDNERDYERAVRTNNNYGSGGWKTYDSQGREWTTYDYRPSGNNSSSNETKKQESKTKVDNILNNYPDYNDDWKKRKSRY